MKIWETLKHPDSQNGKVLTREFQSLLEEEQKDFEASEKRKREKARENKDFSVKEQISVEADKRQIREDFKEKEKSKASEEIKQQEIKDEKVKQDKSKLNQEIKSKEICFSDVKKVEPVKPAVKIRRSKLPPPRQRNKIQVTFTERVFPTPMRESKVAEEDEWLQKQSMARKKHKEIELDLLPHEKEEGFLEEKGIKLYKNGEFEGAINAYDIAIQMFPAKASLHLNRAEANLSFGNAVRGAQDAARALEMFTPACASNACERVRCHLARGRALRKMQMFTEALMDFTAAKKIDEKNTEFDEEIEQLRKAIQTGQDSWKDEWETDLL